MARNGNGNGSHQQGPDGDHRALPHLLPHRGEVRGDGPLLSGDPQADLHDTVIGEKRSARRIPPSFTTSLTSTSSWGAWPTPVFPP